MRSAKEGQPCCSDLGRPRAGQRDEAVRHLGSVLQRDPGNAQAIRMLTSPAEVVGYIPDQECAFAIPVLELPALRLCR